MQLQTRKELKENTKNTQENILILSNSLSKYVENNDFYEIYQSHYTISSYLKISLTEKGIIWLKFQIKSS